MAVTKGSVRPAASGTSVISMERDVCCSAQCYGLTLPLIPASWFGAKGAIVDFISPVVGLLCVCAAVVYHHMFSLKHVSTSSSCCANLPEPETYGMFMVLGMSVMKLYSGLLPGNCSISIKIFKLL